MGEDGPVQLRVREKYLVTRTYGHKTSGSGHSGSGGHRHKTGPKQVHDHRVPVLVDGHRTSWMRYSTWNEMDH
jgi:hypothetical protein